MQRLHTDDLVAHLQQTETWEVLSFPARAEKDEPYELITPYGRRIVQRKTGDILHPALLSASGLEACACSMTEYNFAAQYQQDPQPPAGLIVQSRVAEVLQRERKSRAIRTNCPELGYG